MRTCGRCETAKRYEEELAASAKEGRARAAVERMARRWHGRCDDEGCACRAAGHK